MVNLSSWFSVCCILLTASDPTNCLILDSSSQTRRNIIKTAAKRLIASSVVATGIFPQDALAQVTLANDSTTISDAEIKKVVESDILERQFLVTGNLTPRIYRPTALFTDEIDTYQMDQWMKGTQKLFVGEKSEIRLVGDVQVSPEQVEFRFDEDLMFRIPFRPTVALTGKVILARDEDGFITSYREFWDQNVFTVLKSAKF
mmetsp:Transcript_11751/g.15438  ORF Transcript_11751/g.15438 Transcript_11751/m.15438 type:complete len:202 (-) Transcript_11751:58-663(-)|eukprot:CAMPEP_0198137912 /NCGR_PEP_ID=MMETSP1443-20131203/1344_1 /TAXON_ID=186043 /ORGANISM="Entomoneis sp., Strain CCMP2396" /LENGTH=201 /DNA_ID=CAMNT_0043799489 /DNA_START=131 /DNA_END=736 /DNA_ORIENTATION=-